MKNLEEILLKETETLKIQYVEKTKDWASISFENMKKSDFLYLRYDKYFINRFGKTKSEDANFVKTANILNAGFEVYLQKSIEAAELHYYDSIKKLADRISKKGLEIENLKVITSHVGINIETILTDNKKTVKAFTIIAEGCVQRPHYRYLIK